MSLLNSTTWRGERLISNSIKLVKITDCREVNLEAKDNKPPTCATYLTLSLQEPATDTDGQPLEPGFYKEVNLNTYPNGTNGDDQLARMGQDNEKLFWRIVAAALAEPNNHELPGKLAAMGGADALKGKLIRVEFKAKGGYQNIKGVMPAGDAKPTVEQPY